MTATIINSDWVYAFHNGAPTLLRDTPVLIEGDRIAAIGTIKVPAHATLVNLPGHLLLPGLISGHTHVAGGTPTRGLIETGRRWNRPLMLVEELSDTDLDALTLHNLYEIVRTGCTTLLEMSLSQRQAESFARVAAQFPVRAWASPMMPGRNRLYEIWFRENDKVLFDSEQGTLDEIEWARGFGRRNHNALGGRLNFMIAPHACDTQTPATLQAIREVAREFGTGLHIHLSQGERETATVKRLWGKTPAEWLAEHGLLGGPAFGAHMSGLDWDRDPRLLAEHGTVFAHCPSAGGAGYASQPYPEALSAGIKVNIAIDTHSNDMLENLKLAVLYGRQRARLLQPYSAMKLDLPTMEDALAGCTHVAADALQRPDLGRISPGCKADLISVNVSDEIVGVGEPAAYPLNHLLYAHGSSVCNVMVDGVWMLRDGRCVAADAAEIKAKGGESIRRLRKMLAEEGWFDN